jgi:predicted nuclease of predicted toxin-antitoxin system
MRLVADACVAASLVHALRAAGHEVVYVSEGQAGVSDSDVLAEAVSDNRILVTEDHDFGALAVRDRLATRGVVLIQLPGLSHAFRNARVLAVLALGDAALGGAFTVIEPGRVRSRVLDTE